MATATATVINNNAELLELPHRTVLINNDGDLIRVMKSTLIENPHLIMVTATGHVTRIGLGTLDPSVDYSGTPFTVIA